MSGGKFILREKPHIEDKSWVFSHVPASFLIPPPPRARRSDRPKAKLINFTPEKITLELQPLSSNRVVISDDPSKLIIASFSQFRFPDVKPSVSTDYMIRLFQAGLFLNGVQYRFFGHGNSQLRGRGCYLREANNDEELDHIIYAMGDLEKIMNVAKRAKRIGLLFSGAEIDYTLDPRYVGDIDDLMTGDENFSDGCGLMARRFSMQVSKAKGIIFQGKRYTPCVFQIRYRGYKGVLMLHPALDKAKQHLVEFRKSMRKFTATADHISSVVDYSKPYSFGRLNNEIVILLSSLGITTDTFLSKQLEYLRWIAEASRDPIKAFEFVSSLGKQSLAEKILLDGIDSPNIAREVRSAQMGELAAFRKNDDDKKQRVRMLVHKSRRLFGVCDPHRVLREGQVHVRITTSRNGASTLRGLDVIVVRNPCLHPGDILKLRAVDHPDLSHLVDCVVFPSQGRRAAPSMSSGGDLDGDEYLVCWDTALVPTRVAESYGYPPNREPPPPKGITRQDLAKYFASYNNSGMARTAALHNKWARYAPDGALSRECQELNALYSQAVDGARITIPERLKNPPVPEDESQFILNQLFAQARHYSQQFLENEGNAPYSELSQDQAHELILRLFSVEESNVSEYKLVNMARAIARKHNIDFRPYLPHVNFGALLAHEKNELAATLDLPPQLRNPIWNSLLRSEILTIADLTEKGLAGPIRVQRLYSSKSIGLYAFFDYLSRAMQEYTRRLMIIKLDERFAIAIFMRGEITWEEDAPVDGEHVVCASFLKESALTTNYKPCTTGFRLHCGYGNVQLFNGQRSNTFIHMRKPPTNSGEELITSIALQQISARVQRQMGRVNRTPVVAVEIHVVSNRDRVAHQLFDLRFDHVATEDYIKRMAHQASTYQVNAMQDADLGALPDAHKIVFTATEAVVKSHLASAELGLEDLDKCAENAWRFHLDDHLFWIFDAMLARLPLDEAYLSKWMTKEPLLVYSLLKTFVPSEDGDLQAEAAALTFPVVQHIIRSADAVSIASLVALEKVKGTIASLDITLYLNLLDLVTLAVRAPQLVQETLFVLHECREAVRSQSSAMEYIHKHVLAVACDRAEEAGDECPCDEDGRLKRQRNAPALVPLLPVEDKPSEVIAHIRVDASSTIRLHSHVRLRTASKPEKGHREPAILDGVVTQAQLGEVRISLVNIPPPEFAQMQWYLYDAGSVATFRAMMEALRRLAIEQTESCRFYKLITSREEDLPNVDEQPNEQGADDDSEGNLNISQRQAVVASSTAQVSLIWGPPGTGKTTVVVRILRRLLKDMSDGSKILMTASTNNAVDNVLERFARLNQEENLVPTEKVIRFATDRGKVNKALQSFTVESRVGGEIVRDSNRRKKAEKIVNDALIVFTTCAGAGLGSLRHVDFDVVLIDEASQITEPVALIPLVKGCQKAVLVGDHVQLRPMVRSLGQTLMHDVSLFERLYTRKDTSVMKRTMLDVQYRFPEKLARFPSSEFYEDRLRTGVVNVEALLQRLLSSQFPWPQQEGSVLPAVFIACAEEEDYGGMSKSNEGQARLVKHIVRLLTTARATGEALAEPPLITTLSPYTKQRKLLHDTLPASTPSFTIDSFQGRESDIIIFSTVRSNASLDIGFVEDKRRLNVAWTRAKLALIVVGDRRTMTGNGGLWTRAIDSCVEVTLPDWPPPP